MKVETILYNYQIGKNVIIQCFDFDHQPKDS